MEGMVSLVCLEPQPQRVILDSLVIRDLVDHLERMELKVIREIKEYQDHEVSLVY